MAYAADPLDKSIPSPDSVAQQAPVEGVPEGGQGTAPAPVAPASSQPAPEPSLLDKVGSAIKPVAQQAAYKAGEIAADVQQAIVPSDVAAKTADVGGAATYAGDVAGAAVETAKQGIGEAASAFSDQAQTPEQADAGVNPNDPIERLKRLGGGALQTLSAVAEPAHYAAGETAQTVLEASAIADPAGSGAIMQRFNDNLVAAGITRNTVAPSMRLDILRDTLLQTFADDPNMDILSTLGTALNFNGDPQKQAAALYMSLLGLVEFTASGGPQGLAGGIKLTAAGLSRLNTLRASRAAAGALRDTGGLSARIGAGPTGPATRVLGANVPAGEGVGALGARDLKTPASDIVRSLEARDRVEALRAARFAPPPRTFAAEEAGEAPLGGPGFNKLLKMAAEKIAKKEPLTPDEEAAYKQATAGFQSSSAGAQTAEERAAQRPASGGYKTTAMSDIDVSKMTMALKESGFNGMQEFEAAVRAGKEVPENLRPFARKIVAGDLERTGKYAPEAASRHAGIAEPPKGGLADKIASLKAKEAAGETLTPSEMADLHPSEETNRALMESQGREPTLRTKSGGDAMITQTEIERQARKLRLTSDEVRAKYDIAPAGQTATEKATAAEATKVSDAQNPLRSGGKNVPPSPTPRAPSAEPPGGQGRMPGDIQPVRQPMLRTEIDAKTGQARLAPGFEPPTRPQSIAFPEEPLKGGTAMGQKLTPTQEEFGKQLTLAQEARKAESLSGQPNEMVTRAKNYVRAMHGVGAQDAQVMDGLVKEFGLTEQQAAAAIAESARDAAAAAKAHTILEKITRVLGVYKVSRAAGDLSFTFRQARKFVGNPKIFAQGLRGQAERMTPGGAQKFSTRMTSLFNDLVERGWDQTDLFWATTRETSATARVAGSEENAATALTDMISGRVPVLGGLAEFTDATNEAAAAMTNIVRGQTALGYSQVMEKLGIPFGKDQMQALAHVLNAAAMRGFKAPKDIRWRTGLAILNGTFFSPQANAGRIRFYVQAIKATARVAAAVPKGLTHLSEGNPLLRSGVSPADIEAMRLGLTDISTTLVLTAAAQKIMGIESVDMDPASTNFMRADLGPAGTNTGLITAFAELTGFGTQQYGGRNYIDLSNGAAADMRTLWRVFTGQYKTGAKDTTIRWNPTTPIIGDVQRYLAGETTDTETKPKPYETFKNDVLKNWIEGKMDTPAKVAASVIGFTQGGVDVSSLPVWMWVTNAFQAWTGWGNQPSGSGTTTTSTPRAPLLKPSPSPRGGAGSRPPVRPPVPTPQPSPSPR